jgi:dihydroorotate dehydrogenase
MAAYLRAFRRSVVRTVVTGTAVVATVELTTQLPSQGRASTTYHRFVDHGMTPLLRQYLDPEIAHHVAIYCAQQGLAPIYRPSAKEQATSLDTTVLGLHFSNPIGLAAGFDKNGQAVAGLQNIGFGSVEIGSVTPLPQPGNPKPRMFRLAGDGAIINRYGFNSEGIDAVAANLMDYRTSLLPAPKEAKDPDHVSTQPMHRIVHAFQIIESAVVTAHKFLFASHVYTPSTLVGVNLGKNKVSETSEQDDYCQGIRTLGPYADYLVINVSSPNTPGLRDLQAPASLQALVSACLEARNQLTVDKPVPLLVKLAPDLTDAELKDIADTLMTPGCQVDGLIVSNTTNQRPDHLVSSNKSETGGLSGVPLKDRSTACIRTLYKHTGGTLPIIGVGGISTARDVMEKLKAGASLVQIYSVLAYEGPGVVTAMRHELAQLLRDEGFRSVEDVVGYDHEELYWKRRQGEAPTEPTYNTEQVTKQPTTTMEQTYDTEQKTETTTPVSN